MSKQKKEPETARYDSSTVVPLPCTEEDLEEHLRAFAASFISSNRQTRWSAGRLRKGTNSQDQMAIFHRQNDRRYCIALDSRDTFPDVLVQRLGNRSGVYF